MKKSLAFFPPKTFMLLHNAIVSERLFCAKMLSNDLDLFQYSKKAGNLRRGSVEKKAVKNPPQETGTIAIKPARATRFEIRKPKSATQNLSAPPSRRTCACRLGPTATTLDAIAPQLTRPPTAPFPSPSGRERDGRRRLGRTDAGLWSDRQAGPAASRRIASSRSPKRPA